MRAIRALCVPLALGVAGMTPATTMAMPVQFNVTATFNADVIVNDSAAGTVDPVNDPVDSAAGANTAFVTVAAATTLGAASPLPNLPNNGFFPANADHPDVQLAYSNEDDGINARRSASTDTYAFTAPPGNYSNVHFFFTAGEAVINPDPSVTVTLIYVAGLPTIANFTVPDWFEDPAAPPYQLFNGGDRAPATAPTFVDNVNDVAIFGFNIFADPTLTLNSVQITRMDTGGAILSFFGATGVTVEQSGSIPEPATLALLGIALAGLGLAYRAT